jgi:hypothetical protein
MKTHLLFLVFASIGFKVVKKWKRKVVNSKKIPVEKPVSVNAIKRCTKRYNRFENEHFARRKITGEMGWNLFNTPKKDFKIEVNSSGDIIC